MNNYIFWEEYLLKIKSKIRQICKEKEELTIDLHIHSNYSADGKQSVKEILDSTKNFDIISITDHDTVNAYDEIYELVKNGLTSPIIVPGVEFTADCKEYRNQCHILQLFINPKSEEIIKNVKTNYSSSFNRSKIQFLRLNKNLAIQKLIEDNNIGISYDEYINYLSVNNLIPEYDTICSYLMLKFKEKSIVTFKILELLEKYNNNDIYEDRKAYKTRRYLKLREKYAHIPENNYNVRFLLSMLAVREIDDDWWDEPQCGSLSVNSYGQLKIDEINSRYCTIWAHPTENSLSIVNKTIQHNKNIIGVELNIRNSYNNIEKFYELLKKNDLCVTLGSDSHDSSMIYYKNMDFYNIKAQKVLDLLDRI